MIYYSFKLTDGAPIAECVAKIHVLLIGREERHLHTTAATKDEHIPFQIQDALVPSHQVQSQQEDFLVDVKHYKVHVELHMACTQGTNDIADSPNNIGLADARCYPTLRSIDSIDQSQLLSTLL